MGGLTELSPCRMDRFLVGDRMAIPRKGESGHRGRGTYVVW
jgi:hypothetical protein